MVTCSRCGREGDPQAGVLPEGWEGTVDVAVCPHCQMATWHPHCTSLVSFGGDRIDTAALARGEQISFRDVNGTPIAARTFADLEGEVERCEYIDFTRSYETASIDAMTDDPPWTCPECGGNEYEFVHADYHQSGLRFSNFGREVDDGPAD